MVTRTITTFTLKVAPDGSWSIPEEILEDLGLKPGDTVVADRTRTGQVIFRSTHPDTIPEDSPLARSTAILRERALNPYPEGTTIREKIEDWDKVIGDAIVADYEASLPHGNES